MYSLLYTHLYLLSTFTVYYFTEKKEYHGRSKGVAQHSENFLKHQKPLPEDFKLIPLSQLPKYVDWREKDVVSPVKDQGHCGSCW